MIYWLWHCPSLMSNISHSCCCCCCFRSPGRMPCPNYEVVGSNLEQWTIQRPRLWVPSPYSLSLMRQSKPAFQWQGTNERIHRQWQQGTKRTQDRHGGHQFTDGSSVTSLVTGGTVFFSEHPGETITHQRGNSLLRVSLNITIFPSKSFSGFRNRGPELVTPSMWNTKVFRSDH